jgi:hypothetical protein
MLVVVCRRIELDVAEIPAGVRHQDMLPGKLRDRLAKPDGPRLLPVFPIGYHILIEAVQAVHVREEPRGFDVQEHSAVVAGNRDHHWPSRRR